MKKIAIALAACLMMCGCGESKDEKSRSYWKKVRENQDDIVEVDWKMLSGNSYIYFTTFEVDGHKYIVATRSYDCITLQHAASCPCKKDK